MLYLAEVQKQKGGLLGGGAKTELKLLACQRTDQNWSTVSEEAISAEDASKLNDGALGTSGNESESSSAEDSRGWKAIGQHFAKFFPSVGKI